MPTVSVIVPTWNRADLIGETLRSVLAQSHRPAEVIVVDDGSTDATAEVVSAFAPAVRYLRKPNGGVASARNHGAREATGTWLAFVDSDDLWHPRKLELQVAALSAVPAARWSLTGCDVIGSDGAPFPGPQGFEGVFQVFSAERTAPAAFFDAYLDRMTLTVGGGTWTMWCGDAYDALFLGNFGLPSSAMVEAGWFRGLGGFRDDLRLAEETEFFHRASASAPLVLLEAPLVSYRRGLGGSLVSSANVATLARNALESLDAAAALRPGRTGRATANWHRGRQRLLEHLAYTQLTNFETTESRRAWHEAWAAGSPRSPRSLALFGATFLPRPLLQALGRLKRGGGAARRSA
jgi:glycosyltransferase involved in cell wall biosynthesis